MSRVENGSEPCKVSAVIPAYNEAGAIAGVVKDVREALEGAGYSYEILVVDDGSSDDTALRAEQAGARVVRHKENRGSGASRKTGTLASRGEWILMIDADGTYPARAIPEILAPLEEFSQVIGARVVEKGTHKWLRTLPRRLSEGLPSFWWARPSLISTQGSGRSEKEKCFLFYIWCPTGSPAFLP